MTVRVGEHYRVTSRGKKLYRDVRQYSCPRGCRGAFFDFRFAHPVDRPERVLFFIPVPKNTVNIIDPLLVGGLVLFYLMFVLGMMLMGVPIIFRLIGVLLITGFAVLLWRFMRTTDGAPDLAGEETPK